MKVIAFCDDPILFLNNRAININETEKYPGLSFVPLLAKKLKRLNIKLVTADLVMNQIIIGKYKPDEVGLISAGGSKLGEYLIKLGVLPLIVFAGESPLWMPDLYLNIDKWVSSYKYKIFFDYSYAKNKDNFNHFYFPSWHENTIPNIVDYNSKQFMTAVIGNKYIINRFIINNKIKYIIKFILLKKFREKDSFFRKLNKEELQTKRLELLEFFALKSKIDLYGSGWKNLENLPELWKTKISLIINDIYKGFTKNKISTISKYKYTLCLENIRYPGYITEKIIDCFIAGTIPVYLGAQDISDYISPDCFIDISKFKNNNELFNFLNTMNIDTYNQYLLNGRKFINSNKGKSYSYESVADQFFKIIEKEIIKNESEKNST